MLRERPVGLLHFIAHGKSDPQAGADASCSRTRPSSTRAQVLGMEGLEGACRAKAPLVFLNACEVGRTTPSLVGAGGFASEFVTAGRTLRDRSALEREGLARARGRRRVLHGGAGRSRRGRSRTSSGTSGRARTRRAAARTRTPPTASTAIRSRRSSAPRAVDPSARAFSPAIRPTIRPSSEASVPRARRTTC